MKLLITILVCGLLTTYQSFGQKHDYHFFQKNIPSQSGMHAYYSDSLADIVFEQFVWDEGTVSNTPALSDKDGNFLCFSNNRYMYDSIGRVAINGDSMGVGWFQEYIMPMVGPEHKGLGTGQNAAFIPIDDSLFYYFHKSSEIWIGNPDYAINLYEKGYRITTYSDGLYLTKVRLDRDGRIYILPEEKKNVLIDDLLMLEQLAFCKKANNEGWWIIVPKIESGDAYRLSLSSSGVIESIQSFDFSENNNRLVFISRLNFNPAGDKLARLIYRIPSDLSQILEIWDFDRCTGEVGERIYYDSLADNNEYKMGGDIEFSESGTYMYIALSEYILQMDMDDMTSPMDTIAKWDGFFYFSFLPPLLGEMIRLPNGKILVGSFVSTPYLHYIHEPDNKGSACNFEQRALRMPDDPLNGNIGTDFEGFPTFPPYRMPPSEYVCEDAIAEESEAVYDIKVYPNPTVGKFIIDFSESIVDIAKVEIYDTQGHLYKSIHKSYGQSMIPIDDMAVLAGIYIIKIEMDKGDVVYKKLFVLGR